MSIGICGTMESNDCMITVQNSDKQIIEIESIVSDFFYKQIKEVILNTLKEHGNEKLYVKIVDKGALDFTIKARLLTAISRMENNNA